MQTLRVLLDSDTVAKTRLNSLDSSLSAPCDPPTPPPTPSPPPADLFQVSFESINPVDVNENDQKLKHSLMRNKRVSFAPDVVIKDSGYEETVLYTPSEISTSSAPLPLINEDTKLTIPMKVSWAELLLSHGALIVVLLTAIAFHLWFSKRP